MHYPFCCHKVWCNHGTGTTKKLSIHKDREHNITSCRANGSAGSRYDQYLAAWDIFSPCTKWPAGFLADGSRHKAAFPTDMAVSDCAAAHRLAFPNHSDEIVQDLHLFPFYPLAHRHGQRHRSFLYSVVQSGPYAARNAHSRILSM